MMWAIVLVLLATVVTVRSQNELTAIVEPGYEVLEEDDFAHFECTITPSSTRVIRIHWSRQDGQRLAINRHFYFDASRKDLIIDPLRLSDGGVYVCTARTENGVVAGAAELVVEPYRAVTACSSNPCLNQGYCRLTTTGYICECTRNFEGFNCESRRLNGIQRTPCLSAPCQNDGECNVVGSNTFVCVCAAGFSGPFCSQEIGACTSNPCLNNAQCVNHPSGYTCQCPIGYLGINCEQVDDNCYSNPCLHGGVCHNAPLRFDCECRGGWEGELCDEDTNDCFPNPCQNGGNCTDMLGAYSCSCASGFVGPRCQDDIDECMSSPCQNNGRCVNADGSFMCQCRRGHTGDFCEEDINECASSPCRNGGQCIDRLGGYNCRCRPGLLGRNCEQGTLASNPCAARPCQNNGVCSLTLTGYECDCVPGSTGDNCEQRDQEPDVPTTEAATTTATMQEDVTTTMMATDPPTTVPVNDPCQPNPCNNGLCARDIEQPDDFVCHCYQGFFGNTCSEIILLRPLSVQDEDVYQVTLFVFNTESAGGWLDRGSYPNSTVDDFPVRLSALASGYYVVRVDRTDKGTVTDTLALSVHGESDISIPTWAGEGILNPTESSSGLVNVQMRLPLYETEPGDAWMVEHRTGSADWQGTIYSALQLIVTLNDIQHGLTAVRVRVRQSDRYSPYSPEVFLTLKDYCEASPCGSHGTCSQTLSSFQCECHPGYTGSTCTDDIDECGSQPCRHGGVCRDEVNAFTCQCADGYAGTTCAIEVDECLPQPCENNARCIDAVNGFTCECQPGYRGDMCEQDIDECASNPCQNGGSCNDGHNMYTCTCPGGYIGQHCQDETDECASNPCQHDSTCFDAHLNFTCACSEGYTGRLCDTEVCSVESPCINGVCMYEVGYGIRCLCDQGYGGSICALEIDNCASNPCANDATCTSSLGSYSCSCPEGYTGQRCDRAVDHCSSQPCQNNGVCRTSLGGYTCECPGGFEGDHCQTASSQPCDSEPCQNGGTCRNVRRGYRCYCQQGFEGADCERTVQAGPCASAPCRNGGSCYARGRRYRCFCRPGFRGRYCERENCKVPGEVFSSCSSACPATCDTPRPSCQEPCVPSCACDVGLVYGNLTKLACMRASQCPYPSIEPKSSIRKPGTGTFLQCSATVPLADITGFRWTRANGSALPAGRHHYFTRKSVLYITDHERDDTGDYVCEVFTGLMSQKATSHIEVTDVKASISPHNMRADRGSSVSLECIVSPEEAVVRRITWRRSDGRPFSSGRTKLSDDRRVLSIDSLRRSDSAEYRCLVVTNLGVTEGATSFVVGEKGCIADGRLLGDGESRYIQSTETIRNARAAADIIFLVDESRSMEAEHAWLANVSIALDNSLIGNGIGGDVPNQFGLIGFAKDDPKDVLGRPIPMPDGGWMGTAAEFNQVRRQLALNGRSEDMYSAIELALDFYPLRPGMACQIVGVTDEGRTPLVQADGSAPLTWQFIHDRLKARGCFLNVIVNEQMKSFEDTGIVDALGVTGDNTSTVEIPGGDFRIARGTGGPVASSGHGTTHEAYTRLAFSTGGAAWDLNRLRVGGDTARSFTKGFVWLKEREISEQLCTSCTCQGGAEAVCSPGCIIEKPQVIITSTSAGYGNTLSAVNQGGLAEFICEADGEPLPEFSWTLEGGGDLPGDVRMYGSAGRSVLQVPNVQDRVCVECVASNADGFLSKVQCVESLATCTLQDRTVEVLHGDSVRNYSTHRGDDVVRLPSSAIVVLVVDESGSMVGEHLWLNTTVQALESNLLAKGVGVVNPNRYALVGFASPADVTGRIISLADQGHCGTAEEMSGALNQLQVDGTLEDGYAAMSLALNTISCLQEARPKEVACQVILATDEGRDQLEPEIQYDDMLESLSRKDCILNVVIWERFRGRELATPSDPHPRWQVALGIDRKNRAVVADGDNFAFLPEGNAWTITGRENTHRTYVQLATQTGGGAWDLEKLRTEQYRQAFTNGFITAKVEEIQQQIYGRCEECTCDSGLLRCSVVEGVSTRQRCISPPANRQLGVVILPVTESLSEGGSYAKFQCSAVLQNSDEDNVTPITVTWVSHPIQAVVDLASSELQFSNLTSNDQGTYTCQARNAEGYGEASVDLIIAPQDSAPQAGTTV
ncbi:uncharacterized protein LOC135827368 [Sycon ciliatum]|uniref:uncharacterized protein LOC135827368 n=1 Tax=Sycon ciliatum TaxID=27933 RepID=UPI0031F639D1